MRHSYRVLIAEIVLTAFISTLIPSSLLFAEDTDPVVSDTIDVVSIENSVASSLVESPTTDIGNILLPEVSSGSTESGSVSSVSTGSDIREVEIASGATLSGSIDPTPIIDTATGNLTITGILLNDESDIDLSQKGSLPGDEHPEREILVQFKSDIDGYVGQYQIDQIESTHDLKTTETISEQNIAVMEIDPPTAINMVSFMSIVDTLVQTGATDTVLEKSIDAKIEELKADPRVEHVQRNFVYQTQAVVLGSSQLWGLDNQGQSVNGVSGTPDADIDYPEAITYAGNKTGSGVIVAVLDTGVVYRHPDLVGHMWNGVNCVSDTGAILGGCISGYDFANNDLDPMDDVGHGTHVAGTIGGVSINSGSVVGVAPNVQIMAVKVLGKNGGTTADIIRGINFASKNGAKVINASFGITRTTQTKSDFDYMMYDAIQDFPGLFVAAAGNSGINMDGYTKSFPAGYGSDTVVSGEVLVSGEVVLSGEEIIPALTRVISVGATDQNDILAPFSNYGSSSVHIAAPGVNIYSSIPTSSLRGTPETISYVDGWTKQPGASTDTWTTRPNAIVTSGESINISGVLWGDTRIPYVSGESSYIEKTIANPDQDVAKVLITTWCDTPPISFASDQIDILVASSGGLYNKVDWMNEFYNSYEPTGRTLIIDGHTGSLAQYRVIADTNIYNATGSFGIRLKWTTDTTGQIEDGVSNYGCFVKDIQIDRTIVGGYDIYEGTSMAAPHVAGAAALAMSYAPAMSMSDIKDAILVGGDWKQHLADKVISGNRLNLLGMLRALEHPTIALEKLTLSGESGIKIKVKTTPENMDAWQQLSISKNREFQGVSGYLGAAQTLASKGIISPQATESGYLLETIITRAELAKLTANLSGYTATSCRGNVFADVGPNLGDLCGYIEALADAGVISTASSIFRPNASATQGEGYKILLSSVGEIPSTNTGSYSGFITETGILAQYARRAVDIGCNISTPLDTYTTRGHMYGIAICAGGMSDISETQGYYLEQNGIGDNQFEFTRLTPDTVYYYKMITRGRLFSSPESPVYSFRTPRIISQTGSGNVLSSGAIYLSGSTASGVTYGTGVQTVILTESGANRVTTTLPLRDLTVTSSGVWDGIIHSPVLVSSATGISLGATNTGVQSIYMIGSETASLALSGGFATISMQVTGDSGLVLPVYRSPNSTTPWAQIGTCVVSGGLCTFMTDHFSLFAVGTPIPAGAQSPVVSGGSGGPGGISGGSISIPIPTLTTLLQKQYGTSLTTTPLIDTVDIDTSKKSTILKTLRSLQFKKALTDTVGVTILQVVRSSIGQKKTLGAQLMSYNNSITSLDIQLQQYRSDRTEHTILTAIKNQLSTERQLFLRDIFAKR